MSNNVRHEAMEGRAVGGQYEYEHGLGGGDLNDPLVER